MKSRKIKVSLKDRILKRDRGFALVAAITLMILLSLISVALMTLAASVSRSSGRGKLTEEARAQARLALQIAIGHLQTELGPDQRITALSGILSNDSDDDSTQGVSNPYILGVWDSWDTWLNRPSQKAGTSITGTYGKGREKMFRRWLISAADDQLLRKWNSVSGGSRLGRGSVRDRSQILLLGKGTLGNDYRGKEVYAGLVEVDSSARKTSTINKSKGAGATAGKGNEQTSKNKNYVAWWVSGENMKARLNLPKYKGGGSDNSVIKVLQHTWDTPTPDTNVIPGLENLTDSLPAANSAEYDQKIEGLFTRGTLALLESGSSSRKKGSYFHDASFDSSGLLTDVRFGGLKKDMNLLLSYGRFPSTDYYETDSRDVSLRQPSAADASNGLANGNRSLASWKQLYYWSNLWDTEMKQGQDKSASLQWQGGVPFSVIASDPDDNSSESTVMNNRYTYLRQPVLLKMYVLIGFMFKYHGSYEPFDGLDGMMGHRPIMVWWNPYNVPLKVGSDGNRMGGFGFGYRVFPVQYAWKCDSKRWSVTDKDPNYCKFATWEKNGWQSNAYAPYGGAPNFKDYANSFGEKTGSSQFIMKPGEIKVFSNDLKYDFANNSENTLNRGRNDVQDAYPFVHQFLGHEITFKLKKVIEVGGGDVEVPVLWKYGVTMNGCQWMWREDYAQTYLRVRIAGGISDLAGSNNGDEQKRYGEQSMYQVFLKEGSGDDKINFSTGFGILSENLKSMSVGDLEQGRGVKKFFPSFMNINWLDERPYDLILPTGEENSLNVNSSLFDVMWDGAGNREGGFGRPRTEGMPFWLSYYGISPKGIYPPSDVNSRYPKNEDLRSKTWLYSSPVFWGSQMTNPTKALRQYHPYQFEIKQRRPSDFTQLDIISGDVVGQIVTNQETGASSEDGGAYFGYRDEDMVSTIVASELPLHPPFSIAGFAGARLTPGWYDESKLTTNSTLVGKRAKRLAYQSGVPAVGVGNSFADPMIKSDTIHYNYSEQEADLADFWDHALMANDALWDSWFTSSMSNRPSSLGGSRIDAREVVTNFVANSFSNSNDVNKMLPNRRFKLNRSNETESTIVSDLTGDKGWEKAARYLIMDGAFNVNSTSLPAWVAILNGLKERQILYADKDSGEPKLLNGSGSDQEVYFTRFAVASAEDTRYGKTLLRLEDGTDKYRWSDLRRIKAATGASDSSDIRELAKQIIVQVKKRGPFLNMSEFINRRLTSSQELGTKGALQAAIDAARLNQEFETGSMVLDAFAQYNFPDASAGSAQTAAPGYLIQSDILAPLGNTLTVRDDTFTVRAYGMVTNPSGTRIEARAWCEAVVQRTVDYVDPTNTPETPAIKVNPATGDMTDSQLSNLNKAFGRKFKVISFRWLSPEEV